MDSSPQVLDLAAGSWGYFLPCNCWSARLAGAAVLAAFLFFGPVWVSSGKLLFDHNWKRKTKRKKNTYTHKNPKPKPTDQICKMGRNHKAQISVPAACMSSAGRSRSRSHEGHQQLGGPCKARTRPEPEGPQASHGESKQGQPNPPSSTRVCSLAALESYFQSLTQHLPSTSEHLPEQT